MTQQVHEFLIRPKRLKAQIDCINLQIAGLREMMLPSGIRYDTDKVQSSPQNTMERYIEKLSVLEEKKRKLEDAYLDSCDDITQAVEGFEVLEQQVIILKYINGRNYSEIMNIMSFSDSSIYRLHRKGTKKLDSILSKTKS